MCGHHFSVRNPTETEVPISTLNLDANTGEHQADGLPLALSQDHIDSTGGGAILNLDYDEQEEEADDLAEAFFNANEDFGEQACSCFLSIL